MKSKHYRIKIYRHRDNEWEQIMECSVSLTDSPKINKPAGEDRWFDERRDTIEKQLESDMKAGGVDTLLRRYKPRTPQRPVGPEIFDDFSWTIEED